MIIAGSGGHGLEVLQLLLNQGYDAERLLFFDENPNKEHVRIFDRPVITNWDELEREIRQESTFCLGVGNPVYRKKLTEQFENLGGKLFGLSGPFIDTGFVEGASFDQMSYAFVGPESKIGKGVLINTRANVHHECEIGEFTEVGPSAILLGAVKVGKMCRIGAGAVILPGINIGDEVVVGAGAVVTKDFLASGKVLKGNPAKTN
jgi:sugar O-acyltransferase (sialic acid O-acetyltransferase NeuD family)